LPQLEIEPWIMQHRAELLFKLHGCSLYIARDVCNLSGLESSYKF